MSRKRFSVEQIINLLREAEVALSGGQTAGEGCRSLGRGVALGWVESGDISREVIAADEVDIEIVGMCFTATPHLRAPYDPSGSRLRS